jgi:DNA mismatch endonuclease (patch repair protein)
VLVQLDMTDHVTAEKRSAIMRAVGTKNTRPELMVRRMLHRAGFRFRLHRKDLPGTPDIVLASRQKVIFVHGCYWHGHPGCSKARLPKTRRTYWEAKVAGNRVRDRDRIRKLRACGWRALVVWQCELRSPERLLKKLLKFLEE